jgi:hypothetical protein
LTTPRRKPIASSLPSSASPDGLGPRRVLRDARHVLDLTAPGDHVLQREPSRVEYLLDEPQAGVVTLGAHPDAQREAPIGNLLDRPETAALGHGKGHLILRGDDRDGTHRQRLMVWPGAAISQRQR